MQYVIVAILVLAALALVIVPLVRNPRGAGAGDIDAPEPQRPRHASERALATSAVAPAARTHGDETAGFPPEGPVAPAPRDPRTTPEPTAPPIAAPQLPGERGAEELPQAAPPPAAPGRPLGAGSADPATEQEILRYREALRARTICPACSTANPPGSKFCKECGEALLVAGAGSRAGQ